VYRNPVDTARSLFRLHQQFCTTHDDEFTRRYMGWLGHHEFGPNHLPLSIALPRMSPDLAPDQPDYWLDYWNAVYCYVLEREDAGIHLVSHDQMRLTPGPMLEAIFAVLGEDADIAGMAAEVRPPGGTEKPPAEFSPELLAIAIATYDRLKKSKLNVYRPTTTHEKH
jgi:hypothetical protein